MSAYSMDAGLMKPLDTIRRKRPPSSFEPTNSSIQIAECMDLSAYQITTCIFQSFNQIATSYFNRPIKLQLAWMNGRDRAINRVDLASFGWAGLSR
jgi:hypothetical protein